MIVLYEMWCDSCWVHLGSETLPAGGVPTPRDHVCDPAARAEEMEVDRWVEELRGEVA